MRNYISRNLLFCVFTALLVMVTALCITGTVIGQNRIDGREMEAFYHEKEKEMAAEVRKYLNDNGFKNSGVALTRVVDEEGNRKYTLTIHHDRIDVMSDEEKNELRNQLSAFNFSAESCSFQQEFLIIGR